MDFYSPYGNFVSKHKDNYKEKPFNVECLFGIIFDV